MVVLRPLKRLREDYDLAGCAVLIKSLPYKEAICKILDVFWVLSRILCWISSYLPAGNLYTQPHGTNNRGQSFIELERYVPYSFE